MLYVKHEISAKYVIDIKRDIYDYTVIS